MNLLMFCLLGAGWMLVAIPAGAGTLYALLRWRCITWPEPARYRRGHVVERVIFSPEAARERFGIRGTVILERETREGEEWHGKAR
jgi:hypothetical protein